MINIEINFYIARGLRRSKELIRPSDDG